MAIPIDAETEWLEADGLGGFASGTSRGLPTRRYHALLLVAAQPPGDRYVLVNGFTAWLETPRGRLDLTRHHYAPGVTTQSAARLVRFDHSPWPCFEYHAPGNLVVFVEVLVPKDETLAVVRFRLGSPAPGVELCVRPLFSGRDFHHLHHENADFRFEPRADGQRLCWEPYPGVPAIVSSSNGEYSHAPDWYRQFRYSAELARGLSCDEDLATPGVLRFDLSKQPAVWLLSSNTAHSPRLPTEDVTSFSDRLIERERRRRASFASELHRSADAYVVRRGQGRTVIAGYPWFADWGRDTFIALRGLALATGRYELARDILVEWSSVVSDGMLPNRFPDHSAAAAEYNSVDASLWYVVATGELLREPAAGAALTASDRAALRQAVLRIVEGYGRGTRFGIRRDGDGLLHAGEVGSQLTWMDAKIGDYVVTPRVGKPVEVQALWINALHVAANLEARYETWLAEACAAFERRFWNEQRSALFDVVDVDHEPGKVDPSLRPNQIFAAGGLPICPLRPEYAAKVVDTVERHLLTPLGLRSLAASEPGYRPSYHGGVWDRDSAYHQGTVWPWLLGPFTEAWLKCRGNSGRARETARRRFLLPLLEHLDQAGLGHVSEVADGQAPHRPGGCPFQAWSVSELIRMQIQLLEP